jgi:Protein of unknown function (DUF2905)
MGRWLIVLGLSLLVIGLLWAWLSKLGLGRLPGDLAFERGGVRIYVPIMTCLVISLVLSLLLWLLNR